MRQLIIKKSDGATGSNADMFSPDDEEAPLEETKEDELDRYTTPCSRGPTPISCRRNKQGQDDDDEPTFNEIMMMITSLIGR